MQVTKSQAKCLGTAISEWETSDLINTEIAGRLRGSFEIVGFDWKRVTIYSFWTSVVCVVIAVGALLADEIIEPLLESVFGSVMRGYGVVFGMIGAALFCLGIYRRQSKPEGTWSNEAVFLLGVCAIAATYLGVKYDDRVARGFGLTFLFINLYTRFFEYSWEHLHKAIFFSVLAISFWYLGSRAERIWKLREI